MNNFSPSSAPSSEPPLRSGSENFLKRFFRRRPATLRTVIEDFIEEQGNGDHAPDTAGVMEQEKSLIANILQLRDLTASDVMIPRADIAAIPHDISRDDLIAFVAAHPQSRFPVYRETLDDIIGTVHIKDLFLAMAPNSEEFNLEPLIREVSIVSPALPVMDILMSMRTTRRHMVMVVDEYGGIDGLVTAGDISEAIIGRLQDEHDKADLSIQPNADGSLAVDARVPVEDIEARFGPLLSAEEQEDIETVGGLVVALAGHIPERGEIIRHASGLEFHVTAADPRRVLSVVIRQPAVSA